MTHSNLNGEGATHIMNARDTFRLCVELCDWSTLWGITDLNVAARRHIFRITKEFASTHYIAESIRVGAALPLLLQVRTEEMCRVSRQQPDAPCMSRHEMFHVPIDSPECAAIIRGCHYHVDIFTVLRLTNSAPSIYSMDTVDISNWMIHRPSALLDIITECLEAKLIEKFWVLVDIADDSTKWAIFRHVAVPAHRQLALTMAGTYKYVKHKLSYWPGYHELSRKVRKLLDKFRDETVAPAPILSQYFPYYNIYQPVNISYNISIFNTITTGDTTVVAAPVMEPVAPAPIPLTGRRLTRMIKSENRAERSAQRLQSRRK